MTVPAPSSAPCSNWATAADVYGCPGCKANDYDQDVIARHLALATEALWLKSGRQWNPGCPVTVRPCCASALCDYPASWWSEYGYPTRPAIVNGQWYNLGAGYGCVAYECGTQFGRLDLGYYPVTEITGVKVDGATLDPSLYGVQGNRWLIRKDGLLWPTTQDLVLADSAPGTWSVTFKHGQPVTPMGVQACAQLACEFTRLFNGDKQCELPLRATAITRQGVTYSVMDVMDVLDRHKTGLYFVDLFLDAWNPEGLQRRPRVLSPDAPRRSRRA